MSLLSGNPPQGFLCTKEQPTRLENRNLTQMDITSHCPQCGAPIYSPKVIAADLNRGDISIPVIFGCECRNKK